MVLLCKYCNKEYASYSSRSNHIKRYHSEVYSKSNPVVGTTSPTVTSEVISKSSIPEINETTNKYKCKRCNAVFKYKQGKWRHEQKCESNINSVETLKKVLNDKDEKIELLTKQNEENNKNLVELKNIVLELINKNCKMHPKTLEKINKQLNSNNTITNSNINSNNTTINNNNTIIQFGKEKLYDVFSKQEQINVLNNGFQCLSYLVNYAHFNSKYPQFKNIAITNLQNNIAYKYNEKTKKFDVVTKDELLSEIISERMYDINEFFDNYGDKINKTMQLAIKSFIQKMDSKTYENEKKKELKIVIYNNKDQVNIKQLTNDNEIEV